MDINSNEINFNEKEFDPIQLICVPIMPVITNLHFQNSSVIIKYNINSLINKKEFLTSSTILSGLNLKILERLKTIKFNILDNLEDNLENKLEDNLENNIKIASFNKYDNLLTITPYHNKYLLITETIILNKIKNEIKNEKKLNLSLKEKFEIDVKNEIIKINIYPIDMLIKELFKEFIITFELGLKNLNSADSLDSSSNSSNSLDSLNVSNTLNSLKSLDSSNTQLLTPFMFQNILISENNSKELITNYIGRALLTIHKILIKDFILKKQILNPHINILRFEKELKISQNIHIIANANAIFTQIKKSVIIYKEDFENITIENQKKILLKQANKIFNSITELELESIPNNFKLYCIS